MIFEHQQYQVDCVSNIVEVLKDSDGLNDFSSLQNNIKILQDKQEIPQKHLQNIPRMDVLMETGTGKTFTYIKTMYELRKKYGVNKFIIFVPRLAIRAGVIQNIDMTSDYFFQEYGVRLKRYIYGDKNGLSQVRRYIRNNNELSVLILTSASITSSTKNTRVLTRRSEDLIYDEKSPLDAISKLNPVIFIDEPHLLKGTEFVKKYKEYFDKSLCLRFGATFPNEDKLSNVIYILDSISAFREYLVKKIRVSTIIDGESSIKFYNPRVKQKLVSISYFKGKMEYKKENLIFGEDIGIVTGNNNYKGVSVRNIKNTEVLLSDKTRQPLSLNHYKLTDESIRLMIRKTIKIHFEKEEELFNHNIKTLSLFFIPNVSDFRGNNPRIKKIFEEEYKKERQSILQGKLCIEYKEYLRKDYDMNDNLQVHEGYFSGDNGSTDEKEAFGVNLILEQKNTLLSTKTPLRFIFSVWALQEGWDNPNIFNICKLTSGNQETSRRQQVGRGLRIAVNNKGKRQTIRYCNNDENEFYNINMLDVIVSGLEINFIEEIQNEIIMNSYTCLVGNKLTLDILRNMGLDDRQVNHLLGFLENNEIITFISDEKAYYIKSPIGDFLRDNKNNLPESLNSKYDKLLKDFGGAVIPPIINRNKLIDTVGLRRDKFKEFENLWKVITRKAKIIYKNIDDNKLSDSIAEPFNKEKIAPVKIVVETKTYSHKENEIELNKVADLGIVNFFKSNTYFNFVIDFAKDKKLPLPFIIKIFNKLKFDNIKNNSKASYQLLSNILPEEIHQSIIQNIGYEFNGEINVNAMKVFYDDEKCSITKNKIESRKLGQYEDLSTPPADNYLYDKIIYDSNIERDTINKSKAPFMVDGDQITVFAKLPRINISLPYAKTYSPDFAYFINTKEGKELFLIVETKGYNSRSEIPDDEQKKIDYAEKFFSQLNDSLGSNIEVKFRVRMNKQSLIDILNDVREGTRL